MIQAGILIVSLLVISVLKGWMTLLTALFIVASISAFVTLSGHPPLKAPAPHTSWYRRVMSTAGRIVVAIIVILVMIGLGLGMVASWKSYRSAGTGDPTPVVAPEATETPTPTPPPTPTRSPRRDLPPVERATAAPKEPPCDVAKEQMSMEEHIKEMRRRAGLK